MAVLLAGCWETENPRHLFIRNATDRPISVEIEQVSGKRILLLESLRPGGVRMALPPNDPDVEGVYRCTTGPVIAFQDGEEIERFEAPQCYEDGLTLTVDGEP